MKPIHIMRFAPADYTNDPFVMLMLRRRAFKVLTFYHMFLFRSHMEGGSLSSDPRVLGASVQMRSEDVVDAVATCIEYGKLTEASGRLYHKRVAAEIAQELEYREHQAETGSRGGRPKKKGSLLPYKSPPLPTPVPTPSPSPQPFGESGVMVDEATCPDCNSVGSLRRANDGARWFCGTRLGGCNSQFSLTDPAIMRQLLPRIRDGLLRRAGRDEPKLTHAPPTTAEEDAELARLEMAKFEKGG